MTLEAPQDTPDFAFEIIGHSVENVGDYTVEYQMTMQTDNNGSPAALAIVQKMVDLLAASPDFVLSSALRRHTRTEPISPTP